MVYAGSPAAEAGVQAGDRIIEINDTKVESIDDAIQALNNVVPEGKVAVRLVRAGKPMDLALTAARLPSNVPADLPPAFEITLPPTRTPPCHSRRNDRIEAARVSAYVPRLCARLALGRPTAGALLWLQAPGDAKPDGYRFANGKRFATATASC